MAGPYLSEIKYLGSGNVDFVEVAVTAGTDVSNVQIVIYNSNGTVRSTDSLGVKVATVAGKDVYVIDKATAADFAGLHKFGAVALVDNGVVLSFVSFNDGSAVTATAGPASGTTSTQIGQAGSGESLETTDGGATYTAQTGPNSGTVPCFVTGTMILTEHGEIPVEQLQAGDRVVTRDNGLQAIRWVGKRTITGATDQRPICIQKDSFSSGVPNRDLYVSPNHRILIHDYRCSLLFDANEVLVAAKTLTSAPTIFQSDRSNGFAYYHILFEQHEIVLSNNMETESFQPGQVGLDAFDKKTRAEIHEVFPELRTSLVSYGETARLCLKTAESRVICAMVPYLMPVDAHAP